MSVIGEETYIGDGVYASFTGHSIKLRAPRENGDHVIYLEPYEFRMLRDFVERIRGWPK